MNKRVIAGVLSAAMVFSFASCGKENAEQPTSSVTELPIEVGTETTTVTEESTTETEEKTTAAETETEAEAEETTKKDSSPELPADITAEQAQEIADNGIKALKEQDIDGIIKYTTMADMFRLENPEATDEEIVEEIKAAMAEEGTDTDMLSMYGEGENAFDFKLTDPVLMTENDAAKINDLFTLMKEEATEESPAPDFPEITGGYKFKVDYSESSLDESMQDSGAWMYVLCTNGEYRLDIVYSLMAEIYGMFSDMASGLEEQAASMETETEDTTSEATVPTPTDAQ